MEYNIFQPLTLLSSFQIILQSNWKAVQKSWPLHPLFFYILLGQWEAGAANGWNMGKHAWTYKTVCNELESQDLVWAPLLYSLTILGSFTVTSMKIWTKNCKFGFITLHETHFSVNFLCKVLRKRVVHQEYEDDPKWMLGWGGPQGIHMSHPSNLGIWRSVGIWTVFVEMPYLCDFSYFVTFF